MKVKLDGAEWAGDGLDVKTTNGGVNLDLPENYNAHLETGTVNGGLRIDFPVSVQGRLNLKDGQLRRLSTDLGSGGSIMSGEVKDGLMAAIPSVLAIVEGIGSSESPAQAVAVTTRSGAPSASLTFAAKAETISPVSAIAARVSISVKPCSRPLPLPMTAITRLASETAEPFPGRRSRRNSIEPGA